MAPWRSGYAEVCKTFYTGSIPVGASTLDLIQQWASGGMVYAADLKSAGLKSLEGSSPSLPTRGVSLVGKAQRSQC